MHARFRRRVLRRGFLVEHPLDAVSRKTELRQRDAGIEYLAVFGGRTVLQSKQLMPRISTGLPSQPSIFEAKPKRNRAWPSAPSMTGVGLAAWG